MNKAAWARFVGIFVAVLVGGLGVLFVFFVAIDPYDSGRFPTFMPAGVVDENQQTANVSRGRDPRFNAAIFGNSRAQLIDPARLSQATGLSFVQLTTPGSAPREQATLLRWFRRHHSRIDAVVLGMDERWCNRDPTIPVRFPFPFWLYGGDLEYLANLLSTRSISAARKRIMLARGQLSPTDPAGYWDYETGRTWNFKPDIAVREVVDLNPAPVTDLSFPALDYIDVAISELPPDTRVVVVMPPQFFTLLPRMGTASAKELVGCKHELKRRASGHPNRALLDFLLDTPLSRDPSNFMDADHYRLPVARMIEERIAGALRTMHVSDSRSR